MSTRRPFAAPLRRVTAAAVVLGWSYLLVRAATPAVLLPPSPVGPQEEDYNQWKKALNTNAATPAAELRALPGFTVELVRSAQPGEGSWVALAFDPRGRIVVAREDRGLLRLTLDTNGPGVTRVETINTNLLECRGLLFAYDALYANANNSKGLFRLRDTDGDDQFDEVKLLKATPGGVGHGRNQLALGPDGMIYSIHGDDVGLPVDGVSSNSPLRHYAEDRLLPCAWDKHLFNAVAKMPFGHLIRTDRDGRTWELVAGGLRNPFGVAFNEAGDCFTFDADMEWDVGLPWYHPCRVLHLVPGGDYGWRRGTGVLPTWSPDTLPSAVDIGLASPTAVQFGTKSNWPEPWRSALFILDWAYGKIYAVYLPRAGSSYIGSAEAFLHGRPLNVTGLDFGPDGAMYFTTGGRRTQAGLYRVRWKNISWWERIAGAASRTSKPVGELIPERGAARGGQGAWEMFQRDDQWRSYTHRIGQERLPTGSVFTNPISGDSPELLLVAARCGGREIQPYLHDALTQSNAWSDYRLVLTSLRAAAVSFARHGPPSSGTASRLVTRLEEFYPAQDFRENEALCELLVYLHSTNVIARTLPLLDSAATQEEKLHYLFTLHHVKSGWTLEQRRTWFEWFARARREFTGGNSLPTMLNYLRAAMEATLSLEERTALADTLAALDRAPVAAPSPPVARSFVKEWTMDDLTGSLTAVTRQRDRARGRRLFAETGCLQCHRYGRDGGTVGPDLTAVSSRFDRRAVLESLIEPSLVVAEVYRPTVVALKNGEILHGRILAEDAQSLTLATNPTDPDRKQRLPRADIVSQKISELSPMPTGLLNTLTRDEVLDLLSWIEFGGDAEER